MECLFEFWLKLRIRFPNDVWIGGRGSPLIVWSLTTTSEPLISICWSLTQNGWADDQRCYRILLVFLERSSVVHICAHLLVSLISGQTFCTSTVMTRTHFVSKPIELTRRDSCIYNTYGADGVDHLWPTFSPDIKI